MLSFVFGSLMVITSVFLILLILIQRGRGGGLTGALGGMGGQSAFGTKAGDVFTRITIVTATIWILVSMGSIAALNSGSTGVLDPNKVSPSSKDSGKSGDKPAAEKSTEKPAEGDSK